MGDELKGCPLCCAKPDIKTQESFTTIHCPVCGCTLSSSNYKWKVIERWNTRPTEGRRENMTIICDRCGKELVEPGALLFHPPISGMCRKEHICVPCFTGPTGKVELDVEKIKQAVIDADSDFTKQVCCTDEFHAWAYHIAGFIYARFRPVSADKLAEALKSYMERFGDYYSPETYKKAKQALDEYEAQIRIKDKYIPICGEAGEYIKDMEKENI